MFIAILAMTVVLVYARMRCCCVDGNECNMQHSIARVFLHPWLFTIRKLYIFSDQIFFSPQHLTAARLQLSVIADDARLERDLFLNLGAVGNLSLDLAASAGGRPNTSTAALALPATKWRPGVPNSVFLQELKLGQKAFPCTCSSVG